MCRGRDIFETRFHLSLRIPLTIFVRKLFEINMIYRSKAPLRIGFAGGGTDVSPYSDLYGGAVLNATVSLYARAAIEPIAEPKITLQAWDQQILCEYDLTEELPADGRLELLKAVYNHFSKNYGIKQGFRLYTSVDAPPGSGLGSSSTLAVALTGAFGSICRWAVTRSPTWPTASNDRRWEWPEESRISMPQHSEGSTTWSFSEMIK